MSPLYPIPVPLKCPVPSLSGKSGLFLIWTLQFDKIWCTLLRRIHIFTYWWNNIRMVINEWSMWVESNTRNPFFSNATTQNLPFEGTSGHTCIVPMKNRRWGLRAIEVWDTESDNRWQQTFDWTVKHLLFNPPFSKQGEKFSMCMVVFFLSFLKTTLTIIL